MGDTQYHKVGEQLCFSLFGSLNQKIGFEMKEKKQGEKYKGESTDFLL